VKQTPMVCDGGISTVQPLANDFEVALATDWLPFQPF